ncbi:cytochrome c oxidase subunit 3 [Flavobacterium pallidum]|uniref:Cytochrome oxidase subunit III n=1 Tax=Flavobacterium pallidum TaxID=2172098 RepID=A0A2S1SLB5_9FLAO|nr:cytochrome c oxidase subunit 3 [Flavobacterium pallidum]AWI27200.1 cytochrome oxidase subunit III [Flavobacterium pallidum]
MQMTYTQEEREKVIRSKKMLLWFAMISMIMVFAGLTSGYIVSKKREDWVPFDLPIAFTISTILILISSVTFHLAKKSIQKDNRGATSLFLLITLVLGSLFVYFQFAGFHELYERQLFPSGSSSKITVSFLYVFVIVHLAHLAGGLISLLVVIYNHFKQKYNSGQTLGLELGAMFWHFLDFLWLYLFLFLYFFK